MLCIDDVVTSEADEEPARSVPSCVVAATERARAEAQPPSVDRRAHPRIPGEALKAVSRVKYGPTVNIIDLSSTGALIETDRPLAPGIRRTLEITGPVTSILVNIGVLRSRLAAILPGRATYRAACAFSEPIDLSLVGVRTPARAENGTAPTAADESHHPDSTMRAERMHFKLSPGTKDVRLDVPGPAGSGAESDKDPRKPVAAGLQKIVARFTDGTLRKGYTQDFVVTRPQFSLWPSITATMNDRVLVPLANLKAVFFVRDFDGDPGYVDRKTFEGPTQGRRIQVTFKDGEIIVGTTLGYRPGTTGFFMTPADPGGNNARIFVVLAAVRQVSFL